MSKQAGPAPPTSRAAQSKFTSTVTSEVKRGHFGVIKPGSSKVKAMVNRYRSFSSNNAVEKVGAVLEEERVLVNQLLRRAHR